MVKMRIIQGWRADVSNYRCGEKGGVGVRPESSIQVWFSRILVLLPTEQASVWREDRTDFGRSALRH